MKRWFAVAAMCVAGSAAMVFAQNARLEGMGSTTIAVDDITDVIGFPAYLLDYPDAIQATYNGAVGPIIGIKQLNKTMSGGVLYDQNRVLDDDAYTFLVDNLVDALANTEPDLDQDDVDPIPHLLFGLDMGAAKLGVDVFCERAWYTRSVRDKSGATETTTKIKGRFLNPGLLASLHLEALRIAAGASVPIAKMYYEQETSAGTVKETAQSKGAVAADVAAELDLDLFDLDWTVGVSGDFTTYSGKYELKPVTGSSTTTTYQRYLLFMPAIYGGLSNMLDEYGVLLAATGRVAYKIDRMKPDNVSYTNRIERDDFVYFYLNTGLEKTWDDLNRLDAIYTRAGITYNASISIDRRDGESGADEYHSRTRGATTRSVSLPLGLGVAKNVFTLDVQMNPVVLINMFKLVNGQIGGTDFVRATMTVDFGKGGVSTSKPRARTAAPLESAPAASGTPDFNF